MEYWRWPKLRARWPVSQVWLSVVAGVIGAALSLSASVAIWHREAQLAELELISRASSYGQALQFGVDAYLDKVAGLRALFDSVKDVSREVFETFSKQVLSDQTALRGLAWIPRVTHEQRDSHERAGVLDGLPNYQIKSSSPTGGLIAAPNADEYYPLFYGFMGSRLVSGLDFKDGAARQRTLERARDSGQMATSPSFTLLSGTGDQSGFFVVLPVYRAGAPYGTVTDRRNSLIGFVHAGFQTDILFASIIEAATKAGGLDLYFFADNDNRDQSAPIHFHGASLRTISTGPQSREALIAGPHWSGKLRVGDADWTLIAVPVPGGPAAASHAGAWFVLICGLLLSAALMAYIWGNAQHARRLHATNVKLDETNLRIDAAINNMPQGLLMFDAAERMIICNDRYIEMYKLSRNIVKPGCSFRELLQHRAASGLSDINPEEVRAKLVAELSKGETVKEIIATKDEREIFITQKPMLGGGWITTHEDITERRRSEAKIAHMAMHDGLTGLPNRRLFSEQVANYFALLARGQRFSVLCLDLDHFKEVNDTFGHPFGDQLLERVGARLHSCIRNSDIVARLGGDEFAILRSGSIESADTAALAARIVDTLGAPFDLDGHEVVIGVSIGIAVAPTDAADAVELLRTADLALYRAKADGRGTYRFFEPAMDQRMQARRALEVDLRKALASDELVLHYQPLVNLATGLVNGYEALIRWKHPERGQIEPADFIPFAEEFALIVRIGEWVLRAACRQAAQWPTEIRVAVNISPIQLRTPMYEVVRGALAQAGLSPDRLELEITEFALLLNQASTLETLRQLRTLGVKIAMDDFGTGHSSLSYLRCFPFDRIKIDCSFIHGLSTKRDSRAIIRAVAGLAGSLGMETTAEGIETQAELDYVKRAGCTEGQGYFFGKALPAKDVGSFLAAAGAKSKAAGR